MLQINNLAVKVDNQPILKGVSLEIKPGEIHAVMGPNGSGKSTLSLAIAGHPKYEVSNSDSEDENVIILEGEDITKESADARAGRGIFLASQYPMAIPGLSTMSFLWQIYKKRNPTTGSERAISLLEFRKWMDYQAEALELNKELLSRSVNDGFSGGEKNIMEGAGTV